MKNPKVSVTIPVHNNEKTLKKCLNSVLNQTYKNYEVIVIDNNSNDNSKKIIKEFQAKNKKIKYIFEPKIGRGAARNTGIDASKGKIILMTDSDCIVPKNWIKELIKPIIYENENAVFGSEEDLIKNYWTKNIQKANLEFNKKRTKGKYIYHIDTKNFAIKKELIKKIKFDLNLNSVIDYDLYLRLKDIIKIRYLPSVKVGHYHKSSFKQVVEVNFRRAYWITTVFKKYKIKKIKNEAMFESLSIKNLLFFPFWIILQFIKKPKKSFFILTSEISWRIGLLLGIIKNK